VSLGAPKKGKRDDTLNTAAVGGIGPATAAALQQLLRNRSAATDADKAGERYAARLADMAAAAKMRDAVIALSRGTGGSRFGLTGPNSYMDANQPEE
jgi:Toprim-like